MQYWKCSRLSILDCKISILIIIQNFENLLLKYCSINARNFRVTCHCSYPTALSDLYKKYWSIGYVPYTRNIQEIISEFPIYSSRNVKLLYSIVKGSLILVQIVLFPTLPYKYIIILLNMVMQGPVPTLPYNYIIIL